MGLIRSWVASANTPDCAFPLNNLPCGVFSTAATPHRAGIAIGDFVLDLAGLEEAGLLSLDAGPLLEVPFWNKMMQAGRRFAVASCPSNAFEQQQKQKLQGIQKIRGCSHYLLRLQPRARFQSH